MHLLILTPSHLVGHPASTVFNGSESTFRDPSSPLPVTCTNLHRAAPTSRVPTTFIYGRKLKQRKPGAEGDETPHPGLGVTSALNSSSAPGKTLGSAKDRQVAGVGERRVRLRQVQVTQGQVVQRNEHSHVDTGRQRGDSFKDTVPQTRTPQSS